MEEIPEKVRTTVEIEGRLWHDVQKKAVDAGRLSKRRVIEAGLRLWVQSRRAIAGEGETTAEVEDTDIPSVFMSHDSTETDIADILKDLNEDQREVAANFIRFLADNAIDPEKHPKQYALRAWLTTIFEDGSSAEWQRESA